MLHAYQKELKGNKVSIVFGSFAPLHQGHPALLFYCGKVSGQLSVAHTIEARRFMQIVQFQHFFLAKLCTF